MSHCEENNNAKLLELIPVLFARILHFLKALVLSPFDV